jgi:hypothetical protein
MNSQSRVHHKNPALATRTVIVLAGAAALIAGCTPSGPNGLGTTDGRGAAASKAARSEKAAVRSIGVGETFRNGAFQLKVTSVQAGLHVYRYTSGMAPTKSRNGQLIVVGMVAKNVGMEPVAFGTGRHLLVDAGSRRFGTEEVRGFDYHAPINPDGSTSGFLVFDVPSSVKPHQIAVQTDDKASNARAVTLVTVQPNVVAHRAKPGGSAKPGGGAKPGSPAEPDSSATPGSGAPSSSATPGGSVAPGGTAKPSSSAAPGGSAKPGSRPAPATTAAPGASPAPGGTATPGTAAPGTSAEPTTGASVVPSGAGAVNQARTVNRTGTVPTATPQPATTEQPPSTQQPATGSAPEDTAAPGNRVFFGYRLR